MSPFCVQTSTGLVRKKVGSYPLLTEAAVLEALEAAVKAYDNDKDLWPTLLVNQRISQIEEFVLRFKTRRSEITSRIFFRPILSFDL